MAGFLLMALMLPAAPVQAGPVALSLTEKDSGRTVTLKVGETLLLNLRNPGSGGYQVLPPVYDGKILTLLSRRDLSPTKSRPGDFGRMEFVWQARQEGDTEVTVNIARPWEKNKSPEQFMKIRVRVSAYLVNRPKKFGGRPERTSGPSPLIYSQADSCDRGKPPLPVFPRKKAVYLGFIQPREI